MEVKIKQALKEWNIAVNALERGNTILLLRKGGIREQKGQFSVEYQQVLLYPTFEHQKPNLLLPEYASQVQAVPSLWHPQTIKISSWAEITDVLAIETSQAEVLISDLLPFLIWNENFVQERVKFKPRTPLFLLLLKPYKLSSIYEIPYDSSYGGCRSWIELKESISIQNSIPVWEDTQYDHICLKIKQLLKQ
ncbi:DUF1802 family protein [Lyngbya sp. PCC 8106]|uniref:DUF1802 family protein n=1 Tax=Lyngbya sp. (strain PCC 8106) TaxID=313612 RepID=UPI0000EAD0BE|nr:DUF1802 family protein [Lyngbya sp. PCC 8106]EAW38224.1 hypothetical protein L8106_09381 [Lyngbya sp. PCC 8106]